MSRRPAPSAPRRPSSSNSPSAPGKGLLGGTPAVPGYRLELLLGHGAHGETWRATGPAGPCVVTVVAVDPTLRARAVHRADELTRIQIAHLVGVGAVVPTVDGLALVSDLVDGVGLGALLASRRVLPAGEVVSLGVPLLRGLARAHELGVAHGDLGLSDVLLTTDGVPHLTDVGVAGVADPSRTPAPAADVHAVAQLLASALGPASDDGALAVRTVLDPALAGHPAARPTAQALADLLAQACPAVDLDVTVTRPSGVPPRPERRAHARQVPPRRLLVGATGLVAAAGVAGGLVLLHGSATTAVPLTARSAAPAATVRMTTAPASGEPAPSSAAPVTSSAEAVPPTAGPAAEDWTAVLTGLDAARSAAFASGDVDDLAAAEVPGSSAYQVDANSLAVFTSAGAHVQGLETVLHSVTPESAADTVAVLDVVDVQTGWTVADASGATVGQHAATGERNWRISLVRQPDGWRVASVEAA